MQRILQILFKNPLLIILPAAGLMLLGASMLLLIPDTNRMMDMYAGMTDYTSFANNIDVQDMAFIMATSLKSALFSLLYCVLFVIFIAGYGNQQSAAVNGGNASFRVFFFGIKKLIGKVILSFLLLTGIIIGFSLIVSIVTTPMIFATVLAKGPSQGNLMGMQKGIQVVMLVIMTLLYPLIVLWLPAIFLDRQEGVMACFKNGLKAGAKKYFRMLAVIVVMLLPTLLLYILSDNIYTMFRAPWFYLIYPYQMIIIPIIVTYLFLQYDDFKKQKMLRRM